MRNQPIGIFDSGVGGLSVFKEIRRVLPDESIIYYADSKHCPYGTRSKEEVVDLSRNIVRFLLSKNAKLIVVACNTATAAAINVLREEFNVPFVGMEPAVKPASINTKTNIIGVLATRNTFEGNHFKKTSERYANDKDVILQIGNGLVELVERGDLYSADAYRMVAGYIEPMISQGADQIVLGCTHYPFLRPIIENVVNGRAQIIDPAPAVANRVLDILHESGKLSNEQAKFDFFSTGDFSVLKKMISLIDSEIEYRIDKV